MTSCFGPVVGGALCVVVGDGVGDVEGDCDAVVVPFAVAAFVGLVDPPPVQPASPRLMPSAVKNATARVEAP